MTLLACRHRPWSYRVLRYCFAACLAINCGVPDGARAQTELLDRVPGELSERVDACSGPDGIYDPDCIPVLPPPPKRGPFPDGMVVPDEEFRQERMISIDSVNERPALDSVRPEFWESLPPHLLLR